MIRTIRLNAKLVDKAEDQALRIARDDLRLAANKTITRIHLGEIHEGEPVHTAAYRIVSGIKGHEPAAYEPTTPVPLGGGVRSAVASHVYDRYREDRRDVAAGRKSLATFRRLPLLFRRQEVRVVDHEHVELLAWGRPDPRWVRFKVWPAGSRTRSTWRAVVARTMRHGDARLQLDRLGRWYVLLSHEVLQRESTPGGGVLGIDIQGGGLVGALFSPDGTWQEERFSPPANFWQLWARDLQLRREIGRTNRLDYALRAGRGRARKIRPFEQRRAKYERRVEDACLVLACAVARYAEKEGVHCVALTRTIGEVVAEQDQTEDVRPRETRAEIRSRFLRRNRARIVERIKTACEPRGIKLVEVSSSRLIEESKERAESTARVIARRGKESLADSASDRPGTGGVERLVAQPGGEVHERRAASGEMIADTSQSLEGSSSSGDASPERSPSRGGGDATNRGSRKRPPKHRGRRDL